MSTINDLELRKRLKRQELAPVYFLYGKEQLVLENCLTRIVKKVVPTMAPGFNLQKFDGNTASLEEIEDAIESLPVMAQKKCVVIHDMDIEKLTAPDHDRLKSILKQPPDTTVLIFYVTGIVVDLKKMYKFKSFATLIDKVGCVVEFGFKTHNEICSIIATKAAERECDISSQVSEHLMELCGNNLRVLLIELEKLTSFVQKGDIKKAHVDMLVSKNFEASVFDLAKMVLQKNYDRSMQLLNDLFYQRIEPIAILGALNMSFVDLYRAKCATTSGKSLSDATAAFDYKGKEWRLKNAFRDSTRYSIHHIGKCIQLLSEADIQVKSTKCDRKIVVEQLVIQMIIYANLEDSEK